MFISSHNMAYITAHTFPCHFFISRAFSETTILSQSHTSYYFLVKSTQCSMSPYSCLKTFIRNDFCLDKFLTQGKIVSSQANIQDFPNSENLKVLGFPYRKETWISSFLMHTVLFIALRFILIIAQKPLSTWSIKGCKLLAKLFNAHPPFSHNFILQTSKVMFLLISLLITLPGAAQACVACQQLCFLHAIQAVYK